MDSIDTTLEMNKQTTPHAPLPPSPSTAHSSPRLPSTVYRLPSTVYRLPSIACCLLIFLFALFFGALAVQQHRTFQTNGLDVGNVDQALWNTAQGRFLHFTLMTPIQSRLALHVEPILLLFVPLYWLQLGGPEALLIIQAIIVCLGAWPLYRLALNNYQRVGNSRLSLPLAWLALIFPLTYLLLPTLESALLFDFHAVTLASTFLLFAFLALEEKNNRRFIFFALLAMACKEDMPLVVAMLGLYAGLAQRRWRLAGLVLGLSAVWFGLVFFIIQPRFAVGGNIQLDRYAWLGDSPWQMLQTLFTQPGLVFHHVWDEADLPGYLIALFFPTAFLALLSPLTLLPMLPPLAINLLSENPFTWRLEDFHYGAPLAPFLFISAIYGLRRVSELASQRVSESASQRVEKWLHDKQNKFPLLYSSAPLLRAGGLLWVCSLLLLTSSLIYHYHRGFTPLARPFNWPVVTAHQQRLLDLLPTLPADTPLFTQSNLAPHLTHRPYIYMDFAYFTDPDFPAPMKATDILLDVTAFENIGGLHQFLRQTLLDNGKYEVVTAQDGLLHLRPMTNPSQAALAGSQSPTATTQLEAPGSNQDRQVSLHPDFYTFVSPDSPPAYQLSVDFDELVRLRGYSLYFNRQEEVQISVDLELLQPLTGATPIQPVLYLLDAAGEPIGATVDLQPTLVWFPPEQWPTGETVRVHFNTLPWYTRQTPGYRLALGFMSGADPWEVSQRYRPVFNEVPDLAIRLPADGTLLELARIEQVWGMPSGGPLPRQFAVPAMPQSLQANFDGQIHLLGYQLSKSEPATLLLTLYWQALSLPEPLTRFVQLVGPDGRIYAQNDSAPDGGTYPTNLWQPGEVVVEQVMLPLPADASLSSYTLHVGLYSPVTGERLPLFGGGDHVEIRP